MRVCAVLFPRSPVKFCCTLVFCFIPCVFFFFSYFASQTPGLCSAIPSAPVKFVKRLCFALFRVFFLLCVCFASQTLGLCSAFPSAPVKFVTRFSCVLVRNFVLRVCLPNTGFVQCYSHGSCEVCYTLVFCFIQ